MIHRWMSLASLLLLTHVELLTAPALAESSLDPSKTTIVVPLSGMGEAGESPVYWDFRLDSGRGSGNWTQIRVPSCWEQEGFGAYYYGTQGRGKPDDDPVIPKERARYRRQFEVPADWQGRAVRIVFEGVMTDATVLVNGHSAGATHQGGFYRFHYDIGSLVRYGASNDIEVIVDKESANESVNRAERRGDYWTFGGIFRPVWLEARPAEYIEWTSIDARADGSVYAQVHLGAPGDAALHVLAQIHDAQGAAVGEPLSAQVEPGRLTAVLRGRVDNAQTWSAETPHLYTVRFTLQRVSPDTVARAEVLHRVPERFGFRTFEVRARDGLYLNGRKIVLKGINRHSFSPETGRTIARAQSYADAHAIKNANMNAVRMSHYPPDPHFLEAADEIGLYVLNELAGWQGYYDTPTGTRLIGQIVRRDVNHPSILFWDNGNEGGWNREVDGEFDRWDPQRRAVLHPWGIHSGINTDHYENYESTVKLSRGPDVFMPTEFLHGLYDGGIGAGLRDYWNVMSASPTVAGGFFWVFADEGLARSDQNGRLDNVGNSAPDGIVGPHGEKEGSYYTVKEIWSPIQIRDLKLDRARGALRMQVTNDFAFTDLDQCTIEWSALRLPGPGGTQGDRRVLSSGVSRAPALAPGRTADLQLSLDSLALDEFDVLHLTVKASDGRELWTWSLRNELIERDANAMATSELRTNTEQAEGNVTVHSAPYVLRFDSETGVLQKIRKDGRSYPLTGGPRLLAFKRTERSFNDVATPGRLKSLKTSFQRGEQRILAEAIYDGPLRKVTWSRTPEGIALSYEYRFEEAVDILGVGFDLSGSGVTSKRWVGKGPYRVWQNRLEGGRFDFHEVAYNDPIPGQTYAYPEFKGYFADWRWLSIESGDERITVVNDAAEIPYFGLLEPQHGAGAVLDLPNVGLSFLTVIPAMGTKFALPEVLGPQSQSRVVPGVQQGRVLFRFGIARISGRDRE